MLPLATIPARHTSVLGVQINLLVLRAKGSVIGDVFGGIVVVVVKLGHCLEAIQESARLMVARGWILANQKVKFSSEVS